MKISSVDLFEVRGMGELPQNPRGHRQAQMLDIYPQFNAEDWALNRPVGRHEIRAAYLEIHSDEGQTGIFGPIDEHQIFVISTYLRSFLLGRDPLATEALHDQMLRLIRHGRSGLFMTGVSAVDCALWDLKGKAWGQPLYRLLGGPVRPALPAYASMLGYSIDPDAAVKTALDFRAQGFSAQKWFFRFGPGDGAGGMKRNMDLVAALRLALGDEYPLMFDAFMGWDLPYAEDMVRRMEPYHITWLEEPLPPERLGSFSRLRQAASVPLATGEHVYTRWQVRELLQTGAVSWIQADPDWTGGVTELVKIAALCSAFDIPLVAHGHSLLPALHLAGAQPATVVPYVEYLIQHQAHKQYFHSPFYEPIGGMIPLPALPGLGIVLDEAKIEQKIAL
jgi:L-alanine-DL-glutamate epimerase-like enolase superfamily enzyme